MRSIGLDIGDYSVKIVELSQNKKSVSIVQVQEKILNPNLTGHDKELEVIEFVRAFMTSGDYSQSRWIMAVPQDQSTIRYKNFPFNDRLKIQKSLSFEMEEDIPFDTENCVFDAKFIQTVGVGVDLLATAVPRHYVEKIIELAGSFGIDLHCVSVEGLALANLVEAWDQAVPQMPAQDFELEGALKPKKSVSILLNIGHKKTILTAYDQNRLIFVRSIFWGVSQIVQDLVKKNSSTIIEANHILHTQGQILLTKQGASFEQTQTSNTISKTVRDFVRDLQMSILELQSEFNADIQFIHICGGGALIPNLGGFLTQHLEVACNPVSLLGQYSLSAFTPAEKAFALESRITTAFALALEGFKKPRNPSINLLKGELAKQNNRFKIFWNEWGATLQVAASVVIVLFVWSYLRTDFATTLSEKASEAVKNQGNSIAKLPKKQATEANVKKYIRENKKKAADMKLVSQLAQMNSALDVLKRVSEVAPDKKDVKIDIRQFNVNDDTVVMTGYVNSPVELSSLTNALKKMANGPVNQAQANLPTVPNRVAFNINFKTDRGVAR